MHFIYYSCSRVWEKGKEESRKAGKSTYKEKNNSPPLMSPGNFTANFKTGPAARSSSLLPDTGILQACKRRSLRGCELHANLKIECSSTMWCADVRWIRTRSPLRSRAIKGATCWPLCTQVFRWPITSNTASRGGKSSQKLSPKKVITFICVLNPKY